jgi:flagellar biosynthesis chaperone FliJ
VTALAEYLTDIYSSGFDKRAAGDESAIDWKRTGTNAGIGAGVGGLGGALRYYLMSDKVKERSSLLNNVLGGALLGGAGGTALSFTPGLGEIASAFTEGDDSADPFSFKNSPWAYSAGIAGDITRVPLAAAAAKGGFGRTGAAALQLLRAGLAGDGQLLADDTWLKWQLRRALDAATGSVIAGSHFGPKIREKFEKGMQAYNDALGKRTSGLEARDMDIAKKIEAISRDRGAYKQRLREALNAKSTLQSQQKMHQGLQARLRGVVDKMNHQPKNISPQQVEMLKNDYADIQRKLRDSEKAMKAAEANASRLRMKVGDKVSKNPPTLTELRKQRARLEATRPQPPATSGRGAYLSPGMLWALLGGASVGTLAGWGGDWLSGQARAGVRAWTG